MKLSFLLYLKEFFHEVEGKCLYYVQVMVMTSWVKILLALILVACCSLFSSVGFAEEEEVYIEVNKAANLLVVFANDVPVYTFLVSTGRTKELTPIGQYKIVTKVINPWYLPENTPGGHPDNPLGTRWLGIDVPGTNGYKYGIHGTNQPEAIGTPFSAGCIRMRNGDVEWVFRHIPLGTKVVIIDK